MAENINKKSDVEAKEAFCDELIKKGYTSPKITAKPSDVVAYKNDKKYYFEIKFTNQNENYFGAATLTEWKAAIENPDSYTFIIAKKIDDKWNFEYLSPKEFLKYSTIPPAKIYFNLPLNIEKRKNLNVKRKTAIIASKERIEYLIRTFEKLKKIN